MIYHGRTLDPVSLWERFVDFPPNMKVDEFSPLVKCPNPDHATEKRHFQVNFTKPWVHCFARCGIEGTYEDAIAMILGVTRRAARKEILKHTRVALGPDSKRKIRDASGRVRRAGTDSGRSVGDLTYDTYLPQVALECLENRNIGAAGISRFGIGWDANERRIVIPAKDEKEILRFLIKRAVRPRDHPKYLYSEGAVKTSLLFGACLLDREKVRSEGLVVCEGSLDCIVLHEYGVTNAVATLGTGISERQARIVHALNPKRLLLFFDKDIAGWHSVQSVERSIHKPALFICLYPKGKSDPAEMTRKEVERSIARAMPLSMFKRRLPKTLTKQKGNKYGKVQGRISTPRSFR